MSSAEFSLENLKLFTREMLKTSQLVTLVQGNINQAIAEKLFNDIGVTAAPAGTSTELGSVSVRNIKKTDQIIAIQSFNDRSADNHRIEKYMQLGGVNLRDRVLLELFTNIVKEPTFDQLRTKLQLGYSTSTNMKQTNGVLGFSTHVQSAADKFDVAYGRV